MTDAAFWLSLPAPVLMLVGLAAGAVLTVVATLVIGALQWAVPVRQRIGRRFGDEPVKIIDWKSGAGWVSAGGELWSAHGPADLKDGEAVTVARMDGLTLVVRRK